MTTLRFEPSVGNDEPYEARIGLLFSLYYDNGVVSEIKYKMEVCTRTLFTDTSLRPPPLAFPTRVNS